MVIQVFIQNEAGSDRKNHHDEQTLTFLRSEVLSRAYPYPYGFVVGTINADGDCLDCFVITSKALKTGEIIDCEAIGLMEQMEDDLPDHNVLAQIVGEPAEVTAEVRGVLTEFVLNVFQNIPGRRIAVGAFLEAGEAEATIQRCRVPDASKP